MLIENIVNTIEVISGGNQIVAAAITGSLTLVVSGGVGWFIKSLPTKVMRFVKSQFSTTLTFNNTCYEKRYMFSRLNEFVHKLSTETGSRSLSVDSYWDDKGERKTVLTLGFGKHYFFYRNRLMFLTRVALESSGGDLLKEQINITVFGRSHQIFRDLIEDNSPKDESHLLAINSWVENRWTVTGRIDCGNLNTLALNDDVRQDFRDKMNFFTRNEEGFRRIGLPYKMTMVLHGLPGSGKTSIIRAVAKEYGMSICILNIATMSDTSLPMALSSIPKNSIVAIEDFDSASSVKRRANVSGDETTDGELLSELVSGLSLTTVLNTLDGICSLDGTIIMMTTNCLESIDDAVLRDGRVDHKIELPLVSSEAVGAHFRSIYPILNTGIYKDFVYPSMTASKLNYVKTIAKLNHDSLLHELEHIKAYNNLKRVA